MGYEYGKLEDQLILEARKPSPDFQRLSRLIALGADVNRMSPESPYDNILSEIILGYGRERTPYHSGRYLPKIIRFFLDHGFDVQERQGRFGGECLRNLCHSADDVYLIECARMLYEAGTPARYEDEDGVSLENCFKEAEKEKAGRGYLRNVYYVIGDMNGAALAGRPVSGIQRPQTAEGKRITGVIALPGSCLMRMNREDYANPVFSFHKKIMIECSGLPLQITEHAQGDVNPNRLPYRISEQMDVSFYFPDCLNQRIRKIAFEQHRMEMSIHLENGAVLRILGGHEVTDAGVLRLEW
jgi:hypothetical protein